MRNIIKTYETALNELIDELILYIKTLNKFSGDTPARELFCKKFFSCAELLYKSGYTDLSQLAMNIHEIFCNVYNHRVYADHETLQTALSFLMLVRQTLMFSDKPDFSEASHAMVFEVSKSLQQLNERISTQ